jgi:benzoyl-CoA reductase subunit D
LRDKLKDGAAKIELLSHELSVHAGAIGAALWGAFRHAKLKQEETANAGGT